METESKTVEQLNEEVRLGNEEFERLEPAGKRIAIAKDVLRQLDQKKLVATSGNWLKVKRRNEIAYGTGLFARGQEVAPAAPMADAMPTETCMTCAVGALFYCALRTARDVQVVRFRRHSTDTTNFEGGRPSLLFNYLEEFFEHDQLRLVELAFERGRGSFRVHTATEELAAEMFVDARWDWGADRRMRAIMENILRNYGAFDPTDLRGLNLIEAAKEGA